jgi:hypothetical protein
MSSRVPMPFACGMVRPTIVLPVAAREWGDEQRRAVLLHELAHVRRRDLPLNLLGRVACALYWFNPLVWIAAARLRAESERACDDLVLAMGARASSYANHLLQIVCQAGHAHPPAVALPMVQRREFEGRMLAILEPAIRRRPPSRAYALAIASLAFLITLPLAALSPVRASGSQAASAATSPNAALPERGEVAQAPARPEVLARSDDRQPAESQVVAAPPAADVGADSWDLDRAARAIVHRAEDEIRGVGPEPTGSFLGEDRGSVDPNVIEALGRALDDPEARVRADAAYALGRLEEPKAVAALGHALRSDQDASVREMAAWALGRIEDPAGVLTLGEAVTSDTSRDVRAMAAWALGAVEDAAAASPLSAALSDRDPEVRGRAAWALGQVEPASAPAALLDALGDPDPDVRLKAAWAVGQIEDPAAIPLLERALDAERQPEAKRAMLWAITQMGGERAQPALIRALEDADAEVRAAAARALAGRGASPWPWPWPMPNLH